MITNMKKAQVCGRLYDVCDIDDYLRYRDSYLPGYVAIQVDGWVLPVTSDLSRVGICVPNTQDPKKKPLCVYCNYPTEDNPRIEEYRDSNIIDYSNVDSMVEFVKKQEIVRSLERDILTNPDNIFTPVINQDDSPAMRAIKQAVIDKHIDIDKYEPRFGSNYNNDKRLFNKSTISLPMAVRICNALDIKATLTLQNSDDNVPNPMKSSITVELTGEADKV